MKDKKKPNEKEVRTLTMPVEVRASEEDDGKNIIMGYALRFNSESETLFGMFYEVIERGALDNADLSDVRALFNHNASNVLGRTKSHTLKLTVDEFGLRYEIEAPDTQFANDLIKSMRRGDIDQSSFGFVLAEDGDEWEYDENRDLYKRTIRSFERLLDVSVVTYPAYQATESLVAERSLENFKQQQANEEMRSLKQKQINLELDLLELEGLN